MPKITTRDNCSFKFEIPQELLQSFRAYCELLGFSQSEKMRSLIRAWIWVQEAKEQLKAERDAEADVVEAA